jgi:hypothetical protein
VSETLKVAKRELGDAGLAYVRRALQGGHELSAAALSTLDLVGGRVFGYYPAAPANVDITRFDGTLFSSRGAFPAEAAGESEDAVIQLAREIGGDLLVLETGIAVADFAARASRTSREPSGERVFLFPHVALWQPLNEGPSAEVSKFISSQGGYDNVFVVDGRDASSAVLSNVAYSQLARATKTLLIPAYDSETYILWAKSSSA